MPVMPPLVSTLTTRNVRASPNRWPLSQGFWGHGTRSVVMRTVVIVRSLIAAFTPARCPSVLLRWNFAGIAGRRNGGRHAPPRQARYQAARSRRNVRRYVAGGFFGLDHHQQSSL